ncbi:TonB-dependent receptor plug domain-containing protein [Sphingomonas floccifaciens]|uniref:TonB-dependent receptor plug domain-containing protein n=1 Tax=Sphingomonas floccifaciens TaxID=1844115 RepID=A0ABW4NI17_9SPHN
MKTSLTHLLITTVLATGVAVPAAAQTAPASQTGDPVADAKLEDTRARTGTTSSSDDTVIVTGTRILRPNNTSAAPITSVTAAEIQAQGATTIEEVLNRLPQIQANAEQNYADSSGGQRIKLRSLGFERTLVLIDGTRMGLTNQQDTGLIPTALVERVDTLSGGASSVYGSDAISGVVNFVLKKNFDGIRLDANYSFYNHQNRAGPVTEAAGRSFFPANTSMVNDGARVNATLAAGKNLFDDAVNISGFVNYRHSDIVPLRNRSYSACEVTQPTRDGALACSVASFTPAGTIIPLSPLAGSFQNRQLVNDPNGTRTFVPINSGPNTAANPYDGFSFQREFERINYGGFLTAKVSRALEFYGTALVYRDESRNPVLARTLNFGAYGSTPYQVACNNPYLSASQATTLCGASAGTATTVPIDVRYRFDDNGPADSRFVNKGYRYTAGARGRLFDDVWNYDAVAVLSRNEVVSRGQTYANFDKVNRALDTVLVNGTPTCRSVVNGTDPACVPFNAFAPFSGSPALSAYLFGGGTFDVGNTSATSAARMFQGLVSIGADLGKYGITSPLATQGIAIAFGGEYRDEKQVNRADAAYRAFYGGTDRVSTQNVVEGNVELQAPLVEDKSWTKLLQLNAGYRLSKYNRLQGTFSTWKVEGIWSPIADIGFRGAFNKAQRAPTVTQAASAANIEYVNVGSRNDPCASTPSASNPNVLVAPTATLVQCRATGLPDNLYGSATLSCPDGACTIRNGGFGLTPETAYTKTFGVILRPRFLPGLTLSADRVLVDLKDSINYYAAADFLNGCLTIQSSFYCRGVVRNPGTFTLFSAANSNPTTGFFAQGLTNGYKSAFHGWDFQGQYGLGIGALGRLDASFDGSLATKVGGQDAPELADRNCVGYFGQFCGESLPRWKHNARVTWSSLDRFANVSVAWRHIASTTISYNVTDPTGTGIPFTASDRRTTYFRTGTYDYFDVALGFEVAKQFSLRFSVNNIFDKDPPLLPNARNVLGLLRNNTLMGYDLLGRQLVAGATVNF